MATRRTLFYLAAGFACIVLGILSGGTLYSSFVVEPEWTGSAESIRNWWAAESVIDGRDFLAIFGRSIAVTAPVLLALGWPEGWRTRKWLIAFFIGIAFLVLLSRLYILPLEMRILDSANLPDAALVQTVDTWVALNFLRLAVGLLCLLVALRVLGLAHSNPDGGLS